jgi:hypothetical protein
METKTVFLGFTGAPSFMGLFPSFEQCMLCPAVFIHGWTFDARLFRGGFLKKEFDAR